MQIIHIPISESNPMPKEYSDPREQDVESTRAAAIQRIHAEELGRIEAQVVNYEIERANMRHAIHAFCQRFGSSHVAECVLQAAKSLGDSL